MRQLSYCGRLAGAVDAHDQNHFRYVLDASSRRVSVAGEDSEHLVLKETFQLLGIADLLAISLLTQSFQHFPCGRRTKVGRQERGLKAIQRVAIDFLGEPDRGLKMFREVIPRAGYRFFHPVEKPRLF